MLTRPAVARASLDQWSAFISHTQTHRRSQLYIWNDTHSSCCLPDQCFAFLNQMHTQMHIQVCMGRIMLNWFCSSLSKCSNRKVSLRPATESKPINSSHYTTIQDDIYTLYSRGKDRWIFAVSTQEINILYCVKLTGNDAIHVLLDVNQTVTLESCCQLNFTKRRQTVLPSFVSFAKIFLEMFHHQFSKIFCVCEFPLCISLWDK